jgi:hypothetical protein
LSQAIHTNLSIHNTLVKTKLPFLFQSPRSKIWLINIDLSMENMNQWKYVNKLCRKIKPIVLKWSFNDLNSCRCRFKNDFQTRQLNCWLKGKTPLFWVLVEKWK